MRIGLGFGLGTRGRNNPTACTLTSEGHKDAGAPLVYLRRRLCGGPGGSLEARTSEIVCIKRELLRIHDLIHPPAVAPARRSCEPVVIVGGDQGEHNQEMVTLGVPATRAVTPISCPDVCVQLPLSVIV